MPLPKERHRYSFHTWWMSYLLLEFYQKTGQKSNIQKSVFPCVLARSVLYFQISEGHLPTVII